MAFDWRVLAAAQRAHAGSAATAALSEQQPGEDTVTLRRAAALAVARRTGPAGSSAARCARLVQASGAGTWGPDYLDLNARAGRRRRMRSGCASCPWTVNERSDMERMLAFEVDGMISDRPDMLRALLAERGLRAAAAPGRGRRMSRARILVIDGNRAATREQQIAAGGSAVRGGLRRGAQQPWRPWSATSSARPTASAAFRRAGSPATMASPSPARRSMSTTGGPQSSGRSSWRARCSRRGVPFFGSCWGMQVAVTAAGGRVRPQPARARVRLRAPHRAQRGRARPPDVRAQAGGVRGDHRARRRHRSSCRPDCTVLAAQRHGRCRRSRCAMGGHLLGRAVPSGVHLRRDRGHGAALRRRP